MTERNVDASLQLSRFKQGNVIQHRMMCVWSSSCCKCFVATTVGEIIYSLQKHPKSLVFEASTQSTDFPGWRSGAWLSHSKSLMCFFFSHFFAAFVTCFGSLWCWKTSPQPVFSVLDETCYMTAQCSEGVLYPQEKNSQRNNVSTSLLYCGARA